MRNVKVKNQLAIALVLGVFLLGSIINAIRADQVCIPFNDFIADDGVVIESKEVCADFVNTNFSLYLLGYVYDDDDNYLGYVNISGGFWLEPDGSYYVYGSACADTASDVDGWAFAEGELAGRGEVVDGPHWNSYASAWDAFYTDNFPAGSGNGLAEITVDGVTIGIEIDGAI